MIEAITVNDIINRYKKSNLIASNPRTSFVYRVFTEADEHCIIRKIKKDPKLGALQLAKEVEKYLGK